MTLRSVRRCYAAAVVLLLVWPAIHFGLVTFALANPWKLAGFAMYTMYHNVDIVIVDTSGPERRDISEARPRINRERKQAELHLERGVIHAFDTEEPDNYRQQTFAILDSPLDFVILAAVGHHLRVE